MNYKSSILKVSKYFLQTVTGRAKEALFRIIYTISQLMNYTAFMTST